ncbi:MAG: hypothetical protein ACLFVU_14560 [Phycisphaerae bacterium]
MKKSVPVFCLLACALLSLSASRKSAAPKPAVEVVGLHVVKPFSKAASSGTSVLLKVTSGGARIVSIAPDSVRLFRFRDNRRTDLMRTDNPHQPASPLGDTWHVADDGASCVFELKAPNTPAAGADELRIEGKLVLLSGAGEKSAVQESLSLATDSKLTAGPVQMKVSQVQDVQWTGVRRIVTLYTSESLAKIKELAFYDADGSRIDTRVLKREENTFLGSGISQISIALSKRVNTAKVTVSYYQTMQKLPVNINVRTGLGF